MTVRKKCFVISPIDSEKSEIRKRSNAVLSRTVRPALGLCGYDVIRADEISEPGIITNQILRRVITDPLLVADLTDSKAVFFLKVWT